MKPILIIFLLLLTSRLFAQTVVSGTVTDVEGELLVGVNIYIENTYDGASSQVDGTFTFTTSESGTQLLKVEMMGYKSQQQEVDLTGQPVRYNFSLEEAFSELNAVVITAGSFEAGDRARSIQLSAQDVATTSGAMGDIVGAINTLPGTTPVGESGRLYVRGGSDEETKTFIDGLLVSKPYHASGPNLSTRGRYNPFLFKGVVFNTGGYSAEYGQALSSVLLLNTIDEKQKDELNISLLAGLGADLSGTKSWQRGSVTATANYFNMKPYTVLASLNQDWKKPSEFYSQETSLKQKTGRHGMFKMYSNINHSDFSLLQNDLDQEGQKIQYDQQNANYFLNTSWTNSFSEKWLFYTGVSATNNQDKMAINHQPINEKLNSAHMKAGMDYQGTEKLSIRFGADYFVNHYAFSSEFDTVNVNGNFNNNLVAGFVEANIYTSTKLVFRLGGRMEYSPLLNQYNYAPRFSSALKINDNSQLSFAFGQFYQTPSHQDLLWKKDLDFERADHYVLNYQAEVNQRIFRTELYYKNYANLVKYDVFNQTDRQHYSNDGYGYAYGFEVFLKDAKSIKDGQFWISYSYLETQRYYRDFPEKATPNFASKHNVSLVYKHFISSWRSMVSANFSYASPRVYHDPNQEGFYNATMPSYQSLNVSWAYLFKNQIIFYGALNNALGRSQQFGYRFANEPDETGIYNSEPIVAFTKRFYVLGVFFTFSKDKTKNQLDKIN